MAERAGDDRTGCAGRRTVRGRVVVDDTTASRRRRSIRVLAAWLVPGLDSAPPEACRANQSALQQQRRHTQTSHVIYWSFYVGGPIEAFCVDKRLFATKSIGGPERQPNN